MYGELIKNLGPLDPLARTWEGDKGDDTAPDDDPSKKEINKYRERLTLNPFGPVNNHAQTLYGLKCSSTAWRLGEDSPLTKSWGTGFGTTWRSSYKMFHGALRRYLQAAR